MQVGTSRFPSVSGGADYPFTLASQGPASDHSHRFVAEATRLRSHVHTDHMDDQSLRGQAPLIERVEPTSHGITFSRHDVLEASHTRKASPLLAGCFDEITFAVGQLRIPLPDKEFRYLRTVHCCYHSRVITCLVSCEWAGAFLAGSHGRP